jgi:hypothetical protein
MRDYLQERTTNLAGTIGGKDAELRAAMIVSSILGITIARHFLELPPLVEADEDGVSRVLDEWIATLG